MRNRGVRSGDSYNMVECSRDLVWEYRGGTVEDYESVGKWIKRRRDWRKRRWRRKLRESEEEGEEDDDGEE